MIQKITTIVSEEWLIDGGMAFGVVPKSIWNKQYPVSFDNLIPVVNRLLLIETDKKLILFNAGYGNKRNEKYYNNRVVKNQQNFKFLLEKFGYKLSDVTDIVFTHLHDDHCGGATCFDENTGKIKPVFENANYYVSENQWFWANNPNKREAAAFFSDNINPLVETNKLFLVKENEQIFSEENIIFKYFDGHTKSLIVPQIIYKNKTIVYLSDFIPSHIHLQLPYISAADIYPLTALEEKEKFLDLAIKDNFILVFEHDFFHEACDLKVSDKGITYNNIGKLHSFLVEV